MLTGKDWKIDFNSLILYTLVVLNSLDPVNL